METVSRLLQHGAGKVFLLLWSPLDKISQSQLVVLFFSPINGNDYSFWSYHEDVWMFCEQDG